MAALRSRTAQRTSGALLAHCDARTARKGVGVRAPMRDAAPPRCRLLVVNGRKLLLLEHDDPLFRLTDWVVLPGDAVAVASVWDHRRDVSTA